MSDQQPPSDAEQPKGKKEAKAEAKAEKAHQKAMRPWYKKKRYVIPLAILVIIVVASIAGGGGDTGTEVADDTTDEQQQTDAEDGGDEGAERIGMNEAARDGQFEFTVTSFECGITSVGEEGFTEEPQGQYCLLGVSVENIGDSAQSLFADNQFLIDDQEREFSADSFATITHNPEGDAFFSEINPGNSIEGEIVFDVPEDANIVQAELHDSALSGGVIVDLQ